MKEIEFNKVKIEEFGKKTKSNNEKLIRILEDMKKDSVLYKDMVDNKAGNLYKEVMLKEINKEIERVKKYDSLVADKIIIASEKYAEFERKVGEEVDGK